MFLSQYPEEFERTLYIDKASINCWLNEQVKPTLTEEERVILRNVKDAEKIGRTPTLGQLYVITKLGATYEIYFNKMFGHLFQFINNGEEYSIEELLK